MKKIFSIFLWCLVFYFTILNFEVALKRIGIMYFVTKVYSQQVQKTEGSEKIKWVFDFRMYEYKNKVGEDFTKEQAKGDYLTGAPAVAEDGTIYFTTVQGILFALSADGELKWEIGGDSKENNVSGVPIVDADGTIYVSGKSFNPDGTLKWSMDDGLDAMALGSDGTLYGTFGYNDFYAVSTNNGEVKWKWTCKDTTKTLTDEYGDEVATVECFSYLKSYPAIGKDGTIYVASQEGFLYALTPDGEIKWKFKTQNPIFSSPAIGNNGTIYIGDNWVDAPGSVAYIYAISPEGKLKWKLKDAELTAWNSAPAIGDEETLYFGIGRCGDAECPHPTVYAIKNGVLKWKQIAYYDTDMTPAIDSDETVYVGSGNTYLWVFKNGKKLWRVKTGATIGESPALLTDGTLYVGSDKFYAIKTNSPGPAKSSWYKFRANLRNTGNVADSY